MKLLISVPTGYLAREILLPLAPLLSADQTITTVFIVTPAASSHQQLFPSLPSKYNWHANPDSQSAHDDLINQLQPDVVLVPTIGLDPCDIPILRAAKKNQVPSLAFISSWDNVFKIERLLSRGHSGHTKSFAGDYELPNHFAVWNEFNQAHLAQIFPDFSRANIHITGPPRFDLFAHPDKIPTKQSLFEFLNISASAKDTHLIHCATTELYPFTYITRAISSGLPQKLTNSNFHIHASVHPGGDINNHLDNKKYGATVGYSFGRLKQPSHPDFSYLPATRDMYMLASLFKHSSVLVNQSSTVAVESMRCDVPVINVKYGRRFDWLRWYRSMVYRDFKQHYRYITDNNGTTIVHQPKQLIAELATCLNDPSLKKKQRTATTKKLITYTDGRCGQRLLSLAKSIV